MNVEPTGTNPTVTGAIRQAARMTGADFKYLLATAQVESNLNPNAQAATSSARGLFQFTEQTWLMTLNPQPLHIDRHFCETETEWGQPLMNSLFTLGLMIGIQVSDMTVGTTIANLGMTEVKFPHPLFEGDTVHCTTEVIGKRESRSRPGAGILEFHHRAYNQNDKLVAECRRQVMLRMRPK